MYIAILLSFGFYWFGLGMIIVLSLFFILFVKINTFDDNFLDLMRNEWKGTIVLPDFDINNTAGYKFLKRIEKEVIIKHVNEAIIIYQINDDEFNKKILWEEINHVHELCTYIN